MLSMGLETGYAMKKHVERNLGYFWSESYGQIYPTLRRLVEEGLATCQAERKRGSRRRKRYKLTPAGWTELRAWLVRPPVRLPLRSELLLKLSFGERVPLEACQELLRGHREVCEDNVEYLAQLETALRGNPRLHRDQPYWLITLRYGRAVREAEVAWCDESLHRLEKMKRERDRGGSKGRRS
jgi:DNA-binding PadR family transcriptional regulator